MPLQIRRGSNAQRTASDGVLTGSMVITAAGVGTATNVMLDGATPSSFVIPQGSIFRFDVDSTENGQAVTISAEYSTTADVTVSSNTFTVNFTSDQDTLIAVPSTNFSVTFREFVPANGEPLWTTDTNRLYIGDGSTAGGILVSGAGGRRETFAETRLGGMASQASDGADIILANPTINGVAASATNSYTLQAGDRITITTMVLGTEFPVTYQLTESVAVNSASVTVQNATIVVGSYTASLSQVTNTLSGTITAITNRNRATRGFDWNPGDIAILGDDHYMLVSASVDDGTATTNANWLFIGNQNLDFGRDNSDPLDFGRN